MNNETKRDVFEGLLESYMYSEDMVIDEISTDGVADRLNLGNIIASTRYRYDAALPDDMPVIPKAVGEILLSAYGQNNLLGILDTAKNGYKISDTLAWIIDNQDIFARAWVLGAWHVEGTGEIVKLKAEK